jgi:hypothetical protein
LRKPQGFLSPLSPQVPLGTVTGSWLTYQLELLGILEVLPDCDEEDGCIDTRV